MVKKSGATLETVEVSEPQVTHDTYLTYLSWWLWDLNGVMTSKYVAQSGLYRHRYSMDKRD